jgi:hypothetical protein
MTWRYLLLEGYCLCENLSDVSLRCHKYSAGKVDIYCLENEEHLKCVYFGFIKAKSSIVLTDRDGNEVNFSGFDCDVENEDDWLNEEESWRNFWNELITENSGIWPK